MKLVKRLIWTWSLLRLVLQSKGYAMKEIPDRQRARWPRRKDGYERSAKVVRLGLAALCGQPTPSVAGKLDALGRKVDGADAKLDTANTKLDSNGGKAFGRLSLFGPGAVRLHDELISVAARWVEGKPLKPFAEEADRRAIEQLESVLRASPDLDGVTPQLQGRVKAAAAGDFQALWPPIQAEAEHRAHEARRKLEARAAAEADALRRILEVQKEAALLNLGNKPQENWIPKQPLPGQKLAKDCDRDLGETPINGGCWVPIAPSVKAPPCGKLFRYGDLCYRPASADPTKPVGMSQGEPGQP